MSTSTQGSIFVLPARNRPDRTLMGGHPRTAQPTFWAVGDDAEQRERFAYALREAMREARLTPPKLAAKLDVAAKTVNRWVNAETLPNVMMVRPLSEALGVRPELIYDPPERPTYPLSEYLVRAELETAVEEGLRRARRQRPAPEGG